MVSLNAIHGYRSKHSRWASVEIPACNLCRQSSRCRSMPHGDFWRHSGSKSAAIPMIRCDVNCARLDGFVAQVASLFILLAMAAAASLTGTSGMLLAAAIPDGFYQVATSFEKYVL